MAKIIAIIIVLLILNVILIFLLKSVVKQINRAVKQNIAEGSSAYDHILRKKEQRIDELNKQILDAAVEPSAAYVASDTKHEDEIELDYLFSKKNYIDTAFFKNYDFVKRVFNFDYVNLLEGFVKIASADEQKNLYAELHESLSPLLQFDLLDMNGDEQYNVLKQSIPNQFDKILDEYIEEHGEFEIINFCEELSLKAKAYDTSIIVKMGRPNTEIQRISPHIKLVEDNTIIEGMKIIYRNTLYDYSI